MGNIRERIDEIRDYIRWFPLTKVHSSLKDLEE